MCIVLQEVFVFNWKKIKLSVLFEFIIHFYYWHFRISLSQIGISHLKWILMFLTVWIVRINHKHWMSVALVVGTTESSGIAAYCTGGIVSNGEKQRCLEKSLCLPSASLCTMILRWTSVGLNLCHHAVKPTGNHSVMASQMCRSYQMQ
jgi:hypothetical protein